MKYVYAAVFEAAGEGGYAVSFPDLPGCYSQGRSLHEAISMAQLALAQWAEYLADKGIPLPCASGIGDIAAPENGFVNLVCAELKSKRAVKRTVSIPQWMDDKVAESGLSLSRVLQDALAERLKP